MKVKKAVSGGGPPKPKTAGAGVGFVGAVLFHPITSVIILVNVLAVEFNPRVAYVHVLHTVAHRRQKSMNYTRVYRNRLKPQYIFGKLTVL